MTELDPAKHGRWHRCETGHVWFAPVQFAEATANLSGEPMAYCPRCSRRAQESTPWVPLPHHYLNGLGWSSAPWRWRRVEDEDGRAVPLALLLESEAGELARCQDPVIMAVREDWVANLPDSPNGKLLAAAPLLFDAIMYLLPRAHRHLADPLVVQKIQGLLEQVGDFEP